MSAVATKEEEEEEEEEEGLVPGGLHSKFNKTGLEFLKSSFLRHVHEILEQGIPDGERNIGDTLRFSWSDLNCPQLEEKDPLLAIVAGEGMRGSIEIESFSLDGKWGYAYKKGLFKWSDSGTFSLAFKRLKVNIIMSIAIEEPSKQLKLFIRQGNADVEAEDVKIRMHSKGIMTQGIINLALPHIERMWRKPAELSKKIEEGANQNLSQIIRLLPVSYPLRSMVLGAAFHVGNLFQSQFDIKEDYCYWELSSVIVPTARYLEYLEKEAERQRAKEKDLKGTRSRFQRNRKKDAEESMPSASSALDDEPPLHPFSPLNFDFPQSGVPRLTRYPPTAGAQDHISYCLSEFTLNTFASSIFDLGLCEAMVEDWHELPGYLQRYIATVCRREPESVRIRGELTTRPELTIDSDNFVLTLNGFILVAADHCPELRASSDLSQEDEVESDENDPKCWKLYHKTHHQVLLRVIPRVDKDFIAKFAFEKIECSSVFEVVSGLSLRKRSTSGKESAKNTMLSIVENMIIVELLPRLYDIGEVGIPLTINEGCLFETTHMEQVPNALVFSGFMRLKEFGKKSASVDIDSETLSKTDDL